MGFLDKAKKMAEQAQAKLDEAQGQFNASQQQGPPEASAVEYDQHGRPIAAPQTEAAGATPPHGDPIGEHHAAAPPEPGAAPTPDPSAPPASGEPDAAGEDRNQPGHTPPPLSSGDPLAG